MLLLLLHFTRPHSFLISTYSIYLFFFFFFNDTATTEIYPLPLHDALPISLHPRLSEVEVRVIADRGQMQWRSEEHTSELQSRLHLVCRLLLEKKKKNKKVVLYMIQKL